VVEKNVFDEVEKIVGQRHHLVTTNRDRFHHSCTACHEDEAEYVK